MPAGVTLWCFPGGQTIPFDSSEEASILHFVSKCRRYGVTKLVPFLLRHDSFPRFVNIDDDKYSSSIVMVRDIYSRWDPLKILVEAAHGQGIEVHPYLPPTHNLGGAVPKAWSLDYVNPALSPAEARRVVRRHRAIWADVSITMSLTEFAHRHRHVWKRDRDGRDTFQRAGNVLVSPASAEVRAYEAEACASALRASGADGVQLEFVLEPRDEQGVNVYGYEGLSKIAYEAEYGRNPLEVPNADPTWIQFRCDCVTSYLREVRASLKETVPDADFSVTVIAGEMEQYWKALHAWPQWVDEGLLDGLYLWFRTTTDLESVSRQTRLAAEKVNGRCRLGVELSCYHPGSFQNSKLLLEAARIATGNGAEEVGVYRSHAVEQLRLWPTLSKMGRV